MPEDILIRTVADPPITNKPDGLGVTMELEDHPVRIFMPKYNRYEPKIRDSTSIKSWKTCQRKYFYEIVLGFSSRETPPYFAWGSAYHKFREVLEVAYGFGHGKPQKPMLQLHKPDLHTGKSMGVSSRKIRRISTRS